MRTGAILWLFLLNCLAIPTQAITIDEYLLLYKGCARPVVFLPDSIHTNVETVNAHISISGVTNNPGSSAVTLVLQLNDTAFFQYLGSINFDSTDTTNKMRYHGYRFLPGMQLAGDSSIVLDFSVEYNLWQYTTSTLLHASVNCNLAPSRIMVYNVYTSLPYLVLNEYQFPVTGYDGQFYQLNVYQKGVIRTLMNWICDKPLITNADYQEVFNINHIGQAELPSNFGVCQPLSCSAQDELTLNLESLLDTLKMLAPASEEFYAVKVAFEKQMMSKCYSGVNYLPQIMSSFTSIAQAIGNQSQQHYNYDVYLVPANACAPIIFSVVQYQTQQVYSASAYSLNLDIFDYPPLSISENGTVTYAENVYPLSALAAALAFDNFELEGNRDTFITGNTGFFKLLPAVSGNYAFYLNNTLKQESESNQFTYSNFHHGDSLRVVLSQGACIFADTLRLNVRDVCVPPQSECFTFVNGFFTEQAEGDPLNASDPFNSDSSQVCGWVSFNGTPAIDLITDTLMGYNQTAVFNCTTHAASSQDGIITATYMPFILEAGQKVRISFFARHDTLFTDVPVKILCYAVDSTWANSGLTDGIYPAVPTEQHAYLMNDSANCIPINEWTYFSFTCTIPYGRAFTRIALLPRLPLDSMAAEKKARIQITGLELTSCCLPSAVNIDQNVYVDNILSDAPALGSFVQWQSGKPVINTGWMPLMTEEAIQRVKFAGKLVVNEDLFIENANLLFEEGGSIEVLPGKKLTISNTIIQGCTQWNGIRVFNGGSLNIAPDVILQHTRWGIENNSTPFWPRQF